MTMTKHTTRIDYVHPKAGCVASYRLSENGWTRHDADGTVARTTASNVRAVAEETRDAGLIDRVSYRGLHCKVALKGS